MHTSARSLTTQVCAGRKMLEVPTLPSEAPGHIVFGRFRLIRKLGAGGMAVVWLAHDERLDLEIALKFLPGLIAHDPEALHDLRREISRGLRLTHEGIVRVFDLHEDHDLGLAAIAMEYVDGATLSEAKIKRPNSCFEVAEPLVSWLRTLCNVLTYVHEEARIIHRDLKPRNLLVSALGRLKVADFGIAATLSESVSHLTQSKSSSGTPAYMSPQQVLARRPSVSDDVYSFGATVYELLTSRPPFFGGSMAGLVQRATSETPPPMIERRAEFHPSEHSPIPRAWEETIQACLAKQPEGRPANLREVAARLRLTETDPPPPRQPSPRNASIIRRLTTGLGAMVSDWKRPRPSVPEES
jgi:serine/threonine protein kinase